jgi:hypothetical protein
VVGELVGGVVAGAVGHVVVAEAAAG